ncbi:MAG: ATP-binding protein [Thermoplasmatales archaeon]|nr:ATP-binding protein [Thermoplasmatales archaeon]
MDEKSTDHYRKEGIVPDQSYEIVPPRPYSLAESLRAFGYSLPNAIADLIDNSITAQATLINIIFWWDGQHSFTKIEDNGSGMNEFTLSEAMRLGNRGPLEVREERDLGRFGLGLKTASFSQCRKVTVRSKTSNDDEATRCWDLDFIKENGDWALLKGVRSSNDEEILGHIKDGHGTVVLWQNMDRVVGDSATDDNISRRNFQKMIDETSVHLGMIFHRFLSGRDAISIRVNETPVIGWDPFLLDKPGQQQLPVERYGTGEKLVTVTPYVLPHQSKIGSSIDFEAAGGPEGWNAHQGFYIYRNKRLISSGGWLGMFKQEEHYKLARIQIDIGNALDRDWKIDVRKARAYPPDDVRTNLKRIAIKTRSIAVEVYRHRGKRVRIAGEPSSVSFVWDAISKGNRMIYLLNREHPLIKRLLEYDDESKGLPSMVLRLVEETIPIPHILGAFSENANQQVEQFSDSEKTEMIRKTCRIMSDLGADQGEIKNLLLSMEPFQDSEELVGMIVSETKIGSERVE